MMTQISKQILTILALVLALALGGALPGAAQGPVLVNPLTGIAIDGYDPVSYFTEPQPLEGKAEYELVWEGVAWRFANPANREVFSRAPEVYAPRFGGHGAMALARGYLSQSNPRLYAIHRGGLYFFYSPANREAFLLAPDRAAADAEANWPRFSGR